MSQHLDLDSLADVLAGESEPPHLGQCEACRVALLELRAALGEVTDVLAALPDPELPDGLAERLTAAVERERRALTAGATAATVTPLAARREDRTRWLPLAGGVAAAAVLVLGGVFALTRGSNPTNSTSAARPAGTAIARSSTGTAYAKDGKALASELPALLKGNATGNDLTSAATSQSGAGDQAVPSKSSRTKALADALAPLHATAGLASCLSALTDPSDPGVPLALDYASFEGQPAMVAVLPSATAGKVDVFVVGAGCTKSDAKLLFFTRLAKP
ncbi:MAG: hypothetical protein JWM02_1141 [Frankiales bacterium]|nr:hypothetical protein [Frankiales bacterium]